MRFIAAILAFFMTLPLSAASGYAGQTVAGAVKWYTFTPQDKTYNTSTQGNCTDGKYLYQVLLKIVNNSEYTEIQKIRLSDWKPVLTMHPRKTVKYNGFDIYHGGDMCYNPDTKEIAVITYSNFTTAAYQLVIIDPETLLPKRRQVVAGVTKFYAIDYDSANKRYVTTVEGKTGREFLTFDSSFKKLRQFSVSPAERTCAVSCDKDYIFCLENDKRYGKFDRARIHIFTWEGAPVKSVLIPTRGEIEDLFRVGDDFYAAFVLVGKAFAVDNKHMFVRKIVPSRTQLLRSPPLLPLVSESGAKRQLDWLYDTGVKLEDWSRQAW